MDATSTALENLAQGGQALTLRVQKLEADSSGLAARTALFEAFTKAQGKFLPVEKNREVEVRDRAGTLLYKFRYADLTEIIGAIRPALAENGLAFTHDLQKGPDGTVVVTRLLHAAGGRLDLCPIPVFLGSGDMKAVAGALTYAKRLSLSAAMGVSAEEDIDAPPGKGESVSGRDTERKPAPRATPASSGAAKPAPRPSDAPRPKDAPPPIRPKDPAPAPDVARNEAPANPKTLAGMFKAGKDHGHGEAPLKGYLRGLYGVSASAELKEWQAVELTKFLETHDADGIGHVIAERQAEKEMPK